jgi:hypothetical protein
MEEVGGDYFLALVSTSLFQQSSGDEYIMYDLAYDLAKCLQTLSNSKSLSCVHPKIEMAFKITIELVIDHY